MTPIPTKLRQIMEADPFMKVCIHTYWRGSTPCSGRITYEHAFIYARKQIQEKWAIVPCCEGHNVGVTGKQKLYNKYIALLRATPQDLFKYPKNAWAIEIGFLRETFREEKIWLPAIISLTNLFNQK